MEIKYKNFDVVLVKSNKPTNLIMTTISDELCISIHQIWDNRSNGYHLYVLSDNNFGIGDWVFGEGELFMVNEINHITGICRDEAGHPFITDACYKVVATTDIIEYEVQPCMLAPHGANMPVPKLPETWVKTYCESPMDTICLAWEPINNELEITENEEVIVIENNQKTYERDYLIAHLYWLRTTSFNVEGHSPEDCLAEYERTLKTN